MDKVFPQSTKCKAVWTSGGLKSDGTSPGLSRAHRLTTSRWGISHALKLLAQACKGLVWPRWVGRRDRALSTPGSASHTQGRNWTKNTPDPSTGCCFSWALEAQSWLCLQGCHPAPPLRHQGRTLQLTTQLQRSLRRCVICSVLVIASHCSGPIFSTLVSVTLFPSIPSGMCKQQRVPRWMSQASSKVLIWSSLGMRACRVLQEEFCIPHLTTLQSACLPAVSALLVEILNIPQKHPKHYETKVKSPSCPSFQTGFFSHKWSYVWFSQARIKSLVL